MMYINKAKCNCCPCPVKKAWLTTKHPLTFGGLLYFVLQQTHMVSAVTRQMGQQLKTGVIEVIDLPTKIQTVQIKESLDSLVQIQTSKSKQVFFFSSTKVLRETFAEFCNFDGRSGLPTLNLCKTIVQSMSYTTESIACM